MANTKAVVGYGGMSEAAQLFRARRTLRRQIRARYPVERLLEQLEGKLVPGPLFEQVRRRIEALRSELVRMGADPDDPRRDLPPACGLRAQMIALFVRLRACGRPPRNSAQTLAKAQAELQRLLVNTASGNEHDAGAEPTTPQRR